MQSPTHWCLKERPAHIPIQSNARLNLLTLTCSVVCLPPQAYSNKFRVAALEASVFHFPLVPWSAAERNGHTHVPGMPGQDRTGRPAYSGDPPFATPWASPTTRCWRTAARRKPPNEKHAPGRIGTRSGRPYRPPLREGRKRDCRGGLYIRPCALPRRMYHRRTHPS